MSYTRYTNRKNERASTKDAARMTRTEANRLTDKVLSALMAAGLVMSPTAVDASEIKDVNNQPVSAESGVYNIYAQKLHGDIAINEFAKFQLDANDIANLYFHKQGETINAGNLLNFVNTRIDINGTVNAIRNGTIGGNLFFLSPEGMAVGKSGVINTGALYVMAPATTSLPGESNYGSLKGVFDKGAATEDHLNAIKNGSPLIPLNPSGTISVLGKINAADDVKLYAAQIAVGRNLTGQAIDGTAAGGVEKAAAIETGVTDFASLVNLTDDQKTAAGLGNLQATQTGNGDIVLAAKAAYANAYDKAFNDLGKLAGLLGTTETPEINVPKTITASVENYGTIKTSTATGDVVLKAEATNGNKDSASGASAFAQTVADVKVQGDVKAAGQVELTAKADNTYVDSGNSVTDNLGDTLSYVVPVGANVMILDNKASVTVEKEAQVEGSQVAVSAEANLDGTAGVMAAGRKLVSKVPSAIPAVGMGAMPRPRMRRRCRLTATSRPPGPIPWMTRAMSRIKPSRSRPMPSQLWIIPPARRSRRVRLGQVRPLWQLLWPLRTTRTMPRSISTGWQRRSRARLLSRRTRSISSTPRPRPKLPMRQWARLPWM